MKVSVNFDDADLRAGVDNLKKKFPYAVRRALKRAAVSGRTEFAKLVREDSGIPSGETKKSTRIVQVGDFGVMLEITGRRVPLIAFKARDVRPSGVTYRLPGSRGNAPHAFVATMRSGHRGVFERTRFAEGAPRYSRNRGPRGGRREVVDELKGPSIPHVAGKYMDVAAERAREAMLKNLRGEIAFALSRG